MVKNQCKPGIQCKFEQNPGLANILLKCTENKAIVECTTDRVWGNGVTLAMDFCLDPRRWIIQGLLGEILEEIRSELKKSTSATTSNMEVEQQPQMVWQAETSTVAEESHLPRQPPCDRLDTNLQQRWITSRNELTVCQTLYQSLLS